MRFFFFFLLPLSSSSFFFLFLLPLSSSSSSSSSFFFFFLLLLLLSSSSSSSFSFYLKLFSFRSMKTLVIFSRHVAFLAQIDDIIQHLINDKSSQYLRLLCVLCECNVSQKNECLFGLAINSLPQFTKKNHSPLLYVLLFFFFAITIRASRIPKIRITLSRSCWSKTRRRILVSSSSLSSTLLAQTPRTRCGSISLERATSGHSWRFVRISSNPSLFFSLYLSIYLSLMVLLYCCLFFFFLNNRFLFYFILLCFIRTAAANTSTELSGNLSAPAK